jgi:hypothetical protein
MQAGDWTEKEVKRFLKREAAFLNEGLDENNAAKLAEQMLYRDRPDEGDNRRLCFECAFYVKRKCKNKQVLLPFILQRCDGFELVRAQQ